MMGALLGCAAAYLVGSIPTGYLMARAVKGIDIRVHGSGNIGMTNVWRVVGPLPGFACLVLDILKGFLPVLLLPLSLRGPEGAEAISFFSWNAGISASTFRVLLAFSVVAGHNWTIFLKFKGGKGVATYIGLLLGLYWQGALIFCALWLIVAFVTRYSSLAALVASALTPVAMWFLGAQNSALLFLLLTTLLWIMHRANIHRLLNGSESRIGRSSAA